MQQRYRKKILNNYDSVEIEANGVDKLLIGNIWHNMNCRFHSEDKLPLVV